MACTQPGQQRVRCGRNHCSQVADTCPQDQHATTVQLATAHAAPNTTTSGRSTSARSRRASAPLHSGASPPTTPGGRHPAGQPATPARSASSSFCWTCERDGQGAGPATATTRGPTAHTSRAGRGLAARRPRAPGLGRVLPDAGLPTDQATPGYTLKVILSAPTSGAPRLLVACLSRMPAPPADRRRRPNAGNARACSGKPATARSARRRRGPRSRRVPAAAPDRRPRRAAATVVVGDTHRGGDAAPGAVPSPVIYGEELHQRPGAGGEECGTRLLQSRYPLCSMTETDLRPTPNRKTSPLNQPCM